MVRRLYTGDDKCPACGAMYCANTDHWPDPEDTVACLGCGHTAKLRAFVDCFEQRNYPTR